MSTRAADHLADLVSATRDAPVAQAGSGLDAVIQAVDSLQVADVVTITERIPSGAMVVVATTDPDAAPLGDVYDEDDPSPCITASSSDSVVHCSDLAADPRWPDWSAETLAHGIHAVISIVLHRQAGPLGCLNLYWRQPHHIDADEVDIARLAGVHCSLELAHHRQEINLWKAIDARNLVGQAQGIVMAQFDIDSAQAFALIRRLSQSSNTKLHVVADKIVQDRRLVLPEPAPAGTPAATSDESLAAVEQA